MNLKEAQEILQKSKEEIAKVIIGQDHVIKMALNNRSRSCDKNGIDCYYVTLSRDY